MRKGRNRSDCGIKERPGDYVGVTSSILEYVVSPSHDPEPRNPINTLKRFEIKRVKPLPLLFSWLEFSNNVIRCSIISIS